jgi:hypothetical protein
MTCSQLLSVYGINIDNLEPQHLASVEVMKLHLEGLEDYGFSRAQIAKMVDRNPALLASSLQQTISLLNNLEVYGFKVSVIRSVVRFYSSFLSTSVQNTNSIFRHLEDYGFTKVQIIKMVKYRPLFLSSSLGQINDCLKSMEAYGFTPEAIRGVVESNPLILGYYSIERITALLQRLEDYGFSRCNIRKICGAVSVILSFKVEELNRLLIKYESLGFTSIEVRGMAERFPRILKNKVEQIDELMKRLGDYGFTPSEIIKMIEDFPRLLKIKVKSFNEFVARFHGGLELADYEIRKMLKSAPSILKCTADRLTALLTIFEEVGYDFREKPQHFMFSPKLLRGRIIVLRRNLGCVPHNKLFTENTKFEKRFGISRDELIELSDQHSAP